MVETTNIQLLGILGVILGIFSGGIEFMFLIYIAKYLNIMRAFAVVIKFCTFLIFFMIIDGDIKKKKEEFEEKYGFVYSQFYISSFNFFFTISVIYSISSLFFK